MLFSVQKKYSYFTYWTGTKRENLRYNLKHIDSMEPVKSMERFLLTSASFESIPLMIAATFQFETPLRLHATRNRTRFTQLKMCQVFKCQTESDPTRRDMDMNPMLKSSQPEITSFLSPYQIEQACFYLQYTLRVNILKTFNHKGQQLYINSLLETNLVVVVKTPLFKHSLSFKGFLNILSLPFKI